MMLVGEAWGKDEEEAGEPFVGASGRILNGMLKQVGIVRKECYLTNVFNLRPQPTNDVGNLCGPREEGIPGMPFLTAGKYVSAQYAPELQRLFAEIKRESPNVIVALGATAAWALLRTSGIRKWRGAPILSDYGKVLPTYHPAAVMRQWQLRPIVLADLAKAVRESEFPEVNRPKRKIWVEPDLDDMTNFYYMHIKPSPALSIDIETIGDMITCVGFAPTIDRAICIPFFDESKPGKNYWPTFEQEREAWDYVRYFCSLKKRIVFQNGLYDMNFLWRTMGITVPHATDDTMLLHHALQPELEKGLGFLGTIYTDEAQWKFMRKNATIKKED